MITSSRHLVGSLRRTPPPLRRNDVLITSSRHLVGSLKRTLGLRAALRRGGGATGLSPADKRSARKSAQGVGVKDDVITSEGASSQVYAQGGLAPLPKGRSRKLHTPPHLSPRLSPYLPIYLPHRPGRQLHAGRPHPVAEALCGRSGILACLVPKQRSRGPVLRCIPPHSSPSRPDARVISA